MAIGEKLFLLGVVSAMLGFLGVLTLLVLDDQRRERRQRLQSKAHQDGLAAAPAQMARAA